jgi:hypothetical protein
MATTRKLHAEPGSGAPSVYLQHQQLEQLAIIVAGRAPLVVVVRDHEWIASDREAALACVSLSQRPLWN